MDLIEAYGEQNNASQNNGGNSNCHQYCLKWNNHKLNVSGVFDRLRASQQFCDLTLSSADKRTIKCHKILLCAGSGYLEEILTENPSEHPTIVLSQINHEELKHLVDFMYSGEVAVETDKLGKLLEAARILKIKGLWESGLEDTDESNNQDDEININQIENSKLLDEVVQRQQLANLQATKAISDTTLDILKSHNKSNVHNSSPISGSQKRKRKSNQQSKPGSDINKNNSILEQLSNGNVELTASNSKVPRLPSPAPSTSSNHSTASSPVSSILSPSSLNAKSPTNLILPNTPLSSSNVIDIAKTMQQYGPMFGVSNAYFLTQPPPLNMILDNNSTGGSLRSSKSSDISSPSSTSAEDISTKLAGLTTPLPPKTIDKLLKDIPKLLTQTPLSSSSTTINPSNISSPITSKSLSTLLPGMIHPSNTTNALTQNAENIENVSQHTKSVNIKPSQSTKRESNSGNSNKSSPIPSLVSKNNNPQPPTTGEVLANGLQLSVAPVRRYKQYTEETLQQALREIMEGQSINRSSMKYNIPARTLRDWMKRLNIKSVFTHNHSSSTSSPASNSKTSESANGNSKNATKTNITVTSVDTSSSTIAIKDLNKVKTGPANTNSDNSLLGTKADVHTNDDDKRMNVVIKTEAVEEEDDKDAKMKQEQDLISSILKKVALPQTLSSSSLALSASSSLSVTAANKKLEKDTIPDELSISKTNSTPQNRLVIAEENEEDDEEEEIDDDEEAL